MAVWLFIMMIVVLVAWVKMPHAGLPAIFSMRNLLILTMIVVAALAILPTFPAEIALIAGIDWALYADLFIAVTVITSRIGWRRVVAAMSKSWRWTVARISIKRRPRAIRVHRQRPQKKPGSDDYPAALAA